MRSWSIALLSFCPSALLPFRPSALLPFCPSGPSPEPDTRHPNHPVLCVRRERRPRPKMAMAAPRVDFEACQPVGFLPKHSRCRSPNARSWPRSSWSLSTRAFRGCSVRATWTRSGGARPTLDPAPRACRSRICEKPTSRSDSFRPEAVSDGSYPGRAEHFETARAIVDVSPLGYPILEPPDIGIVPFWPKPRTRHPTPEPSGSLRPPRKACKAVSLALPPRGALAVGQSTSSPRAPPDVHCIRRAVEKAQNARRAAPRDGGTEHALVP